MAGQSELAKQVPPASSASGGTVVFDTDGWVFSEHAQYRMQERGIDPSEVFAVIANPAMSNRTEKDGPGVVNHERGDLRVAVDPKTKEIITVIDLFEEDRATPRIPTQVSIKKPGLDYDPTSAVSCLDHWLRNNPGKEVSAKILNLAYGRDGKMYQSALRDRTASGQLVRSGRGRYRERNATAEAAQQLAIRLTPAKPPAKITGVKVAKKDDWSHQPTGIKPASGRRSLEHQEIADLLDQVFPLLPQRPKMWKLTVTTPDKKSAVAKRQFIVGYAREKKVPIETAMEEMPGQDRWAVYIKHKIHGQ